MMTDIKSVTEKIRGFQEMEREAVFEIGRLLKHVKEHDLARGKFTSWLESIGYNKRTAQRYIQIYTRFNAMPAARGLPVSKLTELLSLPKEIDPLPLLEDARNDSVRTVRDKVKQAKSAPLTKTGPKKASTLGKVSPVIERVTTALSNLIPEFLELIESGGLSLDDGVALGHLDKDSQLLLIDMGILKVEFDSEELEIYILIAKNEKTTDRALYIVSKVETIQFAIRTVGDNKEFEAAVNEINSSMNDYKRFVELLDKLIARIPDFVAEREAKRHQKQRNWSDAFNSFIDGGDQSAKPDSIKILGLADKATPDEVRTRYRQLMKTLHPDQGGSAYLFQLVKDAYDDMKANGVA